MVRKSFMLIAGETSGDLLGAELVPLLRARVTDAEGIATEDFQPLHASLEPVFFGAGGPTMAAAGVELAVDLTEHSVVGLWEVLREYGRFRRLFRQLVQLAKRREPDVIICIDFSGFNLRFAHAIKRYVRSLQGTFCNWQPRLVQYVSPQVWASRPERAERVAKDSDLLLSILPFEKEWYAQRTPNLRVEFVGHPLVDRHAEPRMPPRDRGSLQSRDAPRVALLPGSRKGELLRHLPVMLEALSRMRSAKPHLQAALVLPTENMAALARGFALPPGLEIGIGELAAVLGAADVAIASTGTVTLECAYFGVPTVALYRTSAPSYWIGKRLIQVRFLAMPNLLANEELFPEFIQDAATASNLSRAALELLDNPERRTAVIARLQQVVASLGGPGASDRAAEAIVQLLAQAPRPIRAALG